MTRRLLTLLVALASLVPVAALVPGTASAGGRIIECGNYGNTRHVHHMHWTYAQLVGGTPAYNLTTRHVRCRRARRFALGFRRPGTYPRWRCSEVTGLDFADVRCTRGRKVIHWQAGA